MDLSTKICQKARSVYADAICYPPGPGPRLDGKPSTAQSESTRELRDGEPQPTGKDYDPRWDPFARMPGSQHGKNNPTSAVRVSLTFTGKFFKFPGPFFAPDATRTNFDQFLLSETHSKLIDNSNRRIANVRANLEKTGRIETTADVAAAAESQAEVTSSSVDFPDPLLISDWQEASNAYAKENGYDLDAIVVCLDPHPLQGVVHSNIFPAPHSYSSEEYRCRHRPLSGKPSGQEEQHCHWSGTA